MAKRVFDNDEFGTHKKTKNNYQETIDNATTTTDAVNLFNVLQRIGTLEQQINIMHNELKKMDSIIKELRQENSKLQLELSWRYNNKTDRHPKYDKPDESWISYIN